MSQLRFLCDEDVSHDIVSYLRDLEPAIDVLVVGDGKAPPKDTPDPIVYRAAVADGRTLISGDITTMLRTVGADLAAGGHNAGAIFLKPWSTVAQCAGDIHLIWHCEDSADWIDRTVFVPI